MNAFLGLSDFLHYPFLQTAIIGTLFLSLLAGLFSPFIIAKKYAFFGEGIGHSTFLGLTLASIIADTFSLGSWALWPSVMIITLILVIPLAYATYHQKLPTDALIGIFLTSTLGLGVILHSLRPSQSDLISFLFGNILLLESYDLLILAALALILPLPILLNFKKWIYFTYDEEGATISGVPTQRYHYLLFFFLTCLMVSAVKIAGTILASSLLLIPGVLAYKFGKNIKQVFLISLIFSSTACLLGLIIANAYSFPPGATLTLTQFSLFALIHFIHMKKLKLK